MKHSKGFSLIELLIVVVILGIVAAIAIPNLLSSRRSANEGSTVSSMRTLHSAQMTYANTYGQGDYAGAVGGGTVQALTILSNLELIDGNLGTATKAGYNFVGGRVAKSSTSASRFFFSAIPVQVSGAGATGYHRYGIATDGVIRFDSTMTQYADTDVVLAAPAFGG